MRNSVICFIFFIACFFDSTANAVTCYGDLIVTKLEDVHDGDTFKVTIDGLHPLIGKNISVRIAGIDTPELRSQDPYVQELAYHARDFCSKLLHGADTIKLKNIRRDKYFRILAEVYIDDVYLADKLVEAGFAHPYDGKTKIAWE